MPYLRVSHAQFDPAQYDELQRLNADLTSAVQRAPGFQQFLTGYDRAEGKAIAVSVFDTLEHAQFSRDLLGDIMPRFQALGLRMEPPVFYEVTP